MNKQGKILRTNSGRKAATHAKAASKELLEEGQHFAHKLYEGGREKLDEAQKNIQIMTDDVIHKIQEKPVTSLFIAAGVGFVLSKLLSK